MNSPTARSKNSALSVLRMLAKVISSISQEDLEALASGKARLNVEVTYNIQNELPIDRLDKRAFEFDQLRNKLGAAASTEAGFTILNEARLTRTELERAARSLDLPLLRQDSVRRLEEKLVEALVGSRLNSRAVRGY